MNSKFITFAVTLLILLGIAAAGFLVYRNLTKPAAEGGYVPESSEPQKEEPQEQETILVKNDFTIVLPVGWQEAISNADVLMVAIDDREEIDRAKLGGIDFRTNFSVKADDMSQYNKVQNMQDYVNSVKTSLIQMIPGIQFASEEEGTIDGRPAVFVECRSTQQNINFETLLVFIEGNYDEVWAISFNTLEDSRTNYRDAFYQIARSFKLK